MNIQDALKETGMAINTFCAHYALIDGQGDLRWYAKNDKSKQHAVLFVAIMRNDWQPYHPEPKKCGACRTIESNGNRIGHSLMEEHLSKYHCTCKEE